MKTATYLYLHGFASSPFSKKAQDLCDRFASVGITLNIPDLNQGDFSHLTLTRQLKQIESEFATVSEPIIVIGSSFGGLTAAWLSQRNLIPIQKLVLLAPAFQFLSEWLPKLGEENLKKWKSEGYLSVYHYGENQNLPLHYQFWQDLDQYQEEQLQREIPTLILHGIHDDVISIQTSRNYAAHRPWVKLIELDSEHTLDNVLERIWQEIQLFLN